MKQFMRFFVVGILGFLVNAGVVGIVSRFAGPLVAQVFAFPAAVTVTWWLNRRYTFGASRYAAHHEWMRYVLANALGWAANNGMYFYLVLHFSLAYRHPTLAVAAGSIAGMLLNFTGAKFLVFHKN
ncbi:GtrA family protein [Burkholderia multivorans]|uniref:GtrA family protein n=1 Tax=Burkholderia multivorans TaxID=87883 RepID=UPI0015623CB8|nr:GtrA family protein [Burkholderia multivorans]MBU9126043.1 GtrA family protein [Burkholderia multivorans]MBU9221203.1 GtrA family protein [Burkholderia multivorans]MBU9364715.1 GtrA family protein [Burkholderia multivorans]MBU9416018.1 GtrA family protein [Burkholderia multivorans]MBU9466913.1 GtrA family protein [Burkholderia multivorans]